MNLQLKEMKKNRYQQICCFSDLASEVFAYMKAGIIIEPERILECIPVEEWRKNDSKYFE